MVEAGDVDFGAWLTKRLKERNIDEMVFGPYITSILEEGDDGADKEDTLEALDGILSGLIVGDNPESFRDEIISKWNMYLKKLTKPLPESPNSLGDKLNEILRLATTEASVASTSKKNVETDPKLRAAILSTVAQSSDSEEDVCSSSSRKKKSESDLESEFGHNANLEKVLDEEREYREQSRAESARKKERDRGDRAKQKAALKDRSYKAKKKAAKVERKS